MIIETRGLRKSFRSRKATVDAVQGVDLVVEEGEIFGFLGPNGAGKTTTLRMLATLITPDGGDATVAGVDLRRGARPRGTGLPGPAVRVGPRDREGPRRRRAHGVPVGGVRRPQVQDVLRRPAPPRRHRPRRDPPAEGGVPRRTHDRARPAEPGAHVGRGAPPARERHDRVHHHALPRRGGRALRPHLDHRQRRDRRRGHAHRAEARGRR